MLVKEKEDSGELKIISPQQTFLWERTELCLPYLRFGGRSSLLRGMKDASYKRSYPICEANSLAIIGHRVHYFTRIDADTTIKSREYALQGREG